MNLTNIKVTAFFILGIVGFYMGIQGVLNMKTYGDMVFFALGMITVFSILDIKHFASYVYYQKWKQQKEKEGED